MGLDMYLTGVKFQHSLDDAIRRTEDGFEISEVRLRLGYWRKHPNLHGYIVQNFAEGRDECQEIELGEEQMLQIIEAVKGQKLPLTTGFFFGASLGTQEERDEDVAILEGAVKWLAEKDDAHWRSVIYQASW